MFPQTKYRNKPTEYRGRRYASKFEAEYAIGLDWKVKAGEVVKWIPQVKLPLVVNDVKICDYVIDFLVVDKTGKELFVEVKGAETKDWKIKWKLAHVLYPELNFVLVKK
jgi:DNA-binding sugar fermentation-stimulating protein